MLGCKKVTVGGLTRHCHCHTHGETFGISTVNVSRNLYSISSVMTFHTISLFLSLQKHYIRIKMMMGKKVESV